MTIPLIRVPNAKRDPLPATSIFLWIKGKARESQTGKGINKKKYAMNKSYSYFHVVSHVKFILSQLYFECNKHFNDGLAISDNISVK